ncbi:MAG: hypothetical protein AMXMBFR84_02650 [Candidatus Hydrogenedentota bacterium]
MILVRALTASCVAFGALAASVYAESYLVGHWPLTSDASDISGKGNNGTAHYVAFDATGGAHFDGRGAFIEVPHNESLDLGVTDFTIAAWVHTESVLDDTIGDILGKFDLARRKGLNFSVMNYHGVVNAQSNYRNLFFGIDDGIATVDWTDCGRPGNAVYPMSLCTYKGGLYAGTFELGKDESGHVYKYAGNAQWEDCGSPYPSNAVSAMAVYQGELYVAASHYRSRGSAMGDSENTLPGGRVYKYAGGKEWTYCGKLGEIEAVYGLAVYKDKLYASSLYAPAGLFRYEGGATWTDVGNPGGRVEALGVHNGQLLGTGFDEHFAGVYRFDDPGWTDFGAPPETTQTYSFMQYRGELFVGSWPSGKVFVLHEPGRWEDRGRLGEEKESMGMAVYNGMLYGGTLPLAQVYRYDGGTSWFNTGQLDKTPDVQYRRAWSMAVHEGKLFCGVLPSGHVYSYQTGRCMSRSDELPAGWVHLAVQRKTGMLQLFINGAMRNQLSHSDLLFDNSAPLRIGFGQHDYFNGRIKDVRIYREALSESDIGALANGSGVGGH